MGRQKVSRVYIWIKLFKIPRRMLCHNYRDMNPVSHEYILNTRRERKLPPCVKALECRILISPAKPWSRI